MTCGFDRTCCFKHGSAWLPLRREPLITAQSCSNQVHASYCAAPVATAAATTIKAGVPRLPATSEMDPTESPCDIHRSTADFREVPWSPRCMAWSQRGHRWQERCHAALQSCDPDLFWCDAGVGQEDSAGFSRHALVGGSAGPSCSGSSGDASVSILTKQTPLQSELSPGQSRLLSETRQSLHWCVFFWTCCWRKSVIQGSLKV